MILNTKRYLAACLLVATTCTVSSTAKVATSLGTSDYNRLACVYFDPSILKGIKKHAEGKERKQIKKAISLIEQGKALPPKLQKIILHKLRNIDPADFNEASEVIASMRKEQDVIPNVSYTTEESIFHELISEEKVYKTSPEDRYYMTVRLENREDSPKKAVSRSLREKNKKKENLDFIPFADLIKLRQANIPPAYLGALLTRIDDFLALEKQLDKLERIAEREDFNSTIEDEIDTLYEEVKKTHKSIVSIFKQLNILKEYKYLIKDRDELNHNPDTGELQICVDQNSKEKISSFGQTLMVKLERVQDEEDDMEDEDGYDTEDDEEGETERDKIKKPYAYEELSIKDHDRKQITNYMLSRCLKIIIDQETGTKYYHVYYQVYDKKRDIYHYYKYTPEGVEEVDDEDDFFIGSQEINTDLLMYEKLNVKPWILPSPWIPTAWMIHIKSVLTGGCITLGAWMYTTTDEAPRRDRRRRREWRGAVPGAGLWNMDNTCWMNASLQAYMDTSPDMLTKTNDPEINSAIKQLIDERDEGKRTGKGVKEKTIAKFMKVVHKNTGGSPLYIPGTQQDADEGQRILEFFMDNSKAPCLVQSTYEFDSFVINRNVSANEKDRFKAYLQRVKTKKDEPNFSLQLALPKGNEIAFQELLDHYNDPSDIEFALNLGDILKTVLGMNVNEADQLLKKMRIYYCKTGLEDYKKKYETIKDDLPEDHESEKLKGTKFDEFKKIRAILTKEDPGHGATFQQRTNPKRLVSKLTKEKKLDCLEVIRGLDAHLNNKKKYKISKNDLKETEDNLLTAIWADFKKFGFGIADKNALKEMMTTDDPKKELPLQYDSYSAEITIKCNCKKSDNFAIAPGAKGFRMTTQRFSREDEDEETKKKEKTFAEIAEHNKNSIKITGIQDMQFKTGFDITSPTEDYEFSGFVLHGGGMGGGHYTAYSIHPADHKWYYYNDSSATLVDDENVVKAASQHAYILYFRKKEALPV